MQIVLLHYAAPPVVGGVETVLAKQARMLARAGHRVRILCGRGATWDPAIPVEVLPRLDSRHADVLRIKASLDEGIVPDEFDDLTGAIRAELEAALRGTDVLIAHNVASLHKNLALTAALYDLSKQSSMPRMILWHHDLAWTAPRYQAELHPGWPWNLLRTPWPGARQVVVSEARRKELAKLMSLPADDIAVIAAGIDLPEFLALHAETQALVERLELASAAPLLLTPVRLTRRKNLELGLRTLACLREQFPAARLVITGPPGAHNPANAAYFSALLDLRAGLGLQACAHLLAEFAPEGLPESSVADLYRLADALLLTSREEGFGIPILEAGLAGLPIFCTDLPALQALAGDRAVYFSPEEDPARVARLIAAHLEGDPLYHMRVAVRTKYTWGAVYARQIAPLLEDA